ncbi:hypothetical protein [Blastomonas aquatica]|uniref:hypothetical protein n=1 Tax=Blastomonas aquatica TaxID=1510276 RepID=UPI0016648136|nr:hypothetical protein [Blastomonas aquatica]
MTRPFFPIWVYFAVAVFIALSAFGVAQVAEGMGMPFVLVATIAWMTFSISRQRKEQSNG